MFSRKTFRYLSFAWPKLRQLALLWGGSLKCWPVSTLHLLQPAWCSWLCPWVGSAPGHRLGSQLQAKRTLLLLSTGATQKAAVAKTHMVSKQFCIPYLQKSTPPVLPHLTITTSLTSVAAVLHWFTPWVIFR